MTQNLLDLAGIDRPMKTTLRDQIYTRLRAAIMAGRFLPGQHLGIIALAAHRLVDAPHEAPPDVETIEDWSQLDGGGGFGCGTSI